MKLINEKKEELLDRKTCVFELNLDNNPTPSREEIRKKIAEFLNVDKKLVIVDTIKTFFRSDKIEVLARIYDNVDTLKKVENKNLLKKHKDEEPKQENQSENQSENTQQQTQSTEEKKEESNQNN